MIALEHQRVAGSENFNDVGGYRARIGEDTEAMPAIAEQILHGFARIVRNREGHHFEVADRKWRVTVDQAAFRQGGDSSRRGGMRAVGEIDGEPMATRKGENPANMVCVLMRDQSSGAAASLASLAVAIRVEKPQSTITFVSPASTIRALP